jgi:hypothetical protein
MFASIPNYKEFYIENDINKQAGSQPVSGQHRNNYAEAGKIAF